MADPAEPLFFATPADFRAWLERHHDSARELLVGYWKKGSGRPSLTWPESVDEALCFGWIDGVRRRRDDDRYTIRFTPRKPGSHWSAVNVKRVEELRAAGRMRPAGEAAFAKRDARRTAQASYESAPKQLDPTAEARFRDNAQAWAFFASQPPGYRRTAIHWVMSAKREETRARRLDTLIEDSAAGRRIALLTRR